MLQIYYFDTNSSHCNWWSEIVEGKGEFRSVGELFTNADNKDLVNALNSNDNKYFFIVHTGESFFNEWQDKKGKWQSTWDNNYSNYLSRICVVFVSAGTLRVNKEDLPNKSHFLYPKSITDKKETINKFRKIIAEWEKTGEFNANIKETPVYLMALFILSQGYLAAHGGSGLGDAWMKIPQELKKKCQDKKTVTEEQSWWALLDNDILFEEIDDLLVDDRDKLKGLLAIDTESKKIIGVKDVKGAYEIIKVALS